MSKVRMQRILTDEEMQEEIRDAISVCCAPDVRVDDGV